MEKSILPVKVSQRGEGMDLQPRWIHSEAWMRCRKVSQNADGAVMHGVLQRGSPGSRSTTLSGNEEPDGDSRGHVAVVDRPLRAGQ